MVEDLLCTGLAAGAESLAARLYQTARRSAGSNATYARALVTRNFGPEDRIALTIPLADGVVIEGLRKARTR